MNYNQLVKYQDRVSKKNLIYAFLEVNRLIEMNVWVKVIQV